MRLGRAAVVAQGYVENRRDWQERARAVSEYVAKDSFCQSTGGCGIADQVISTVDGIDIAIAVEVVGRTRVLEIARDDGVEQRRCCDGFLEDSASADVKGARSVRSIRHN